MRPEKSGVPCVPGVPANAHAGLRRNTQKNARVPCVPKTPETLLSSNAGNTRNTSPKPCVPSKNPASMRLEHREHMGTSDLKVGLDKKHENPASHAVDRPADRAADRPTDHAPVGPAGEPRATAPLTPAERQRRHRAKVKAAAAAHALTAAGRLLPENQRLVRQVEFMGQQIAELKAKAQKSAAQLQQLQQETRAGHERLQAMRASLRAAVPRLPLATATVLRHALKEAGFIAWLDSG